MKKEEIISIFPVRIRDSFRKVAEQAELLQEIRLYAEMPVRIIYDGSEYFLDRAGNRRLHTDCETLVMKAGEMEQILDHLCSYSRYAFEEDIKRGFLTVPGGHRIGLAGQVIVKEDGSVRNLKYVRYMNIRISHEIKGAGNQLLPFLFEEHQMKNTLLIGAPGSGKTTMLRDLIRQISNGTGKERGRQVGLVDERSEIAGCYLGFPGNEVGIRTAVLDGCTKKEGIRMLIRSMAPEVIAVDEIGGYEDMEAVSLAEKSGCRVLATIHGQSMEDLIRYQIRKEGFERFVFLKKTHGEFQIAELWDGNGNRIAL